MFLLFEQYLHCNYNFASYAFSEPYFHCMCIRVDLKASFEMEMMKWKFSHALNWFYHKRLKIVRMCSERKVECTFRWSSMCLAERCKKKSAKRVLEGLNYRAVQLLEGFALKCFFPSENTNLSTSKLGRGQGVERREEGSWESQWIFYSVFIFSLEDCSVWGVSVWRVWIKEPLLFRTACFKCEALRS